MEGVNQTIQICKTQERSDQAYLWMYLKFQQQSGHFVCSLESQHLLCYFVILPQLFHLFLLLFYLDNYILI